MEVNGGDLYSVAFEQCVILTQQVIEYKTLFMQEKKEKEKLEQELNLIKQENFLKGE